MVHTRSMSTEISAAELSKIVPVPRRACHEYLDPLDTIWIHAALRMGIKVVGTHNAYADYDGNGTLAIGTTRNLDSDDCVAQILFHEICHWLVEGRDSARQVNWGVTNTTLRDLDREYASLRVQAALAERFGLRRFLANTTDHRAYYDALPDDPLTPSEDGTPELAAIGLNRVTEPPWAPALTDALAATAVVVNAAAVFAEPPSLFCVIDQPTRPTRTDSERARRNRQFKPGRLG